MPLLDALLTHPLLPMTLSLLRTLMTQIYRTRMRFLQVFHENEKIRNLSRTWSLTTSARKPTSSEQPSQLLKVKMKIPPTTTILTSRVPRRERKIELYRNSKCTHLCNRPPHLEICNSFRDNHRWKPVYQTNRITQFWINTSFHAHGKDTCQSPPLRSRPVILGILPKFDDWLTVKSVCDTLSNLYSESVFRFVLELPTFIQFFLMNDNIKKGLKFQHVTFETHRRTNLDARSVWSKTLRVTVRRTGNCNSWCVFECAFVATLLAKFQVFPFWQFWLRCPRRGAEVWKPAVLWDEMIKDDIELTNDVTIRSSRWVWDYSRYAEPE